MSWLDISQKFIKNERRNETEKIKSVENEEQLPEDIESTKDESKSEVIVEESSTTAEVQD